MEKNAAASALAKRGVKKHPHLHSKDRMKELVKIRQEKKAQGEEPAVVAAPQPAPQPALVRKPKKQKEVKKGELPNDMQAFADKLKKRAEENKDDIPYS